MLYRPRLDGLRSVAIGMVLIEHYAYFIGKHISAGFYGVNLFFVLSGFLITSILLGNKEKTFVKTYKNFIARRLLRIFPIYYIVVILLFLLNVPGITRDILYLISYTFNYQLGYTKDWSTVYTPYWSLSVEEQFYLIYPIMAILLRHKLKILLGITGILIVVAYLQIFTSFLFGSELNYLHLATNMAPLGFGCLGAILSKQGVLNKNLFCNIYVEVSILIFLAITVIFLSWEIRWIVCPLVNLYFVIKCASFKFSLKSIDRYLLNKFSIRIGKISYGIYLFHMIVAMYAGKFIFDPIWAKIPFSIFGKASKLAYNSWIIKFPLYSILTIFIASLSFRFIEQPLLGLKDRYFSNK